MARILLIDDDEAVRTMLRRSIVGAGHVVIEARDGDEGLKLFESAQADIVITDIIMPNREGLEIVMTMRKLQPHLKIIAISGGGRVDGAEYLRTAKAMGAVQVFAKPFSHKLLLEAINQLCPTT